MTAEKILYTDGHKVTVTDSTFRVSKNLYRMDGIVRHNFAVIPPRRVPIVIILSLGVAFLVLGVFDLVPSSLIHHLEVGAYILTTRLLALCFGAAMLVAGLAFMLIEKEKYGVQIVTAEGEKNVIVSKKREYITMIDDALTQALQRWKF